LGIADEIETLWLLHKKLTLKIITVSSKSSTNYFSNNNFAVHLYWQNSPQKSGYCQTSMRHPECQCSILRDSATYMKLNLGLQ